MLLTCQHLGHIKKKKVWDVFFVQAWRIVSVPHLLCPEPSRLHVFIRCAASSRNVTHTRAPTLTFDSVSDGASLRASSRIQRVHGAAGNARSMNTYLWMRLDAHGIEDSKKKNLLNINIRIRQSERNSDIFGFCKVCKPLRIKDCLWLILSGFYCQKWWKSPDPFKYGAHP